MSDLPSCCALRFLMRKWHIGAWHSLPDSDHFTCTKCGQSYVRRHGQWEPISTVEDIRDMMAQERERQRHENA